MAIRMQQRRGTAEQWTLANPVLAAGEIGFETDTNKFKIGDGVNNWATISYFLDETALGGSLDDYILASTLGQPDGVATLDVTGQVPSSQLGNVDFTGYATETYVNTAVSNLVDAAPEVLDTLNELAAAIGDDANFITTINTSISDGDDATLAAAALDATTKANAAQTAAELYADGLAVNYDAAGTASSEVAAHNLDTLNVHGIANTAELETQTGAQAKANNALTAAQAYADSLAVNYDSAGSASTAETDANLYTDGEISAALITAQGYADTAETDAKLYADSLAVNYDAAGTATTEVANHNLDTTNVHGIADTSALALTADVNSALDLKANLASPTFTGTVNATDVIISGDLTVSGTTTTVNATDLVVTDPLIYIGEGNSANLVDLGLVSSFDNGTYQHSGIVRDASDNKWKIFKGVTDEPTTTVNFAQGTLDDLAVAGLEATSATIGDVSNTEIQYLNGVTSSIQTQLDSKAPTDSPTFTGTVSGVTKSMVGLGNVDNTSDANKPVSAATQNALDLKANTASPTFTGTVSLPQTTSIGDVSATEIGYVNGVTSSIQSQIDGKAASVHGHAISDITGLQTELDSKLESADLAGYATEGYVNTAVSNLVDSAPATLDTLNELAAALGDDSNFATTVTNSIATKQDKVAGVSDTEIGYLDGVTSSIQGQIDSKAPSVSPTLTGTTKVNQILESFYTSPTAASGTMSVRLSDMAPVILYSQPSTGNWSVNLIGDGTSTFNQLVDVNRSTTICLLVTNGATPYLVQNFQVDGVAQTVKWLAGSAPTSGSANAIDSYTFTVLKTAASTYTVFGSVTKFA